jgi:hypothetical protein
MSVAVTLVDPNGQEWVAGTAIEVNDLLAQGYRVKGHNNGATPDRLTSGPVNPQNRPSPVANPAPVTNTGGVQPAGDGSGAK